MNGHPLWWILTAITLTWYLVVTILVAVKGSRDIFQMLADLKREEEESQ